MSDEVTRLILKELPKTADEQTIIEHVKKVCGAELTKDLTDCRVIRKQGKSRRIAYIGFKTPAAAAKCLKSVDKTFMLTSRVVATPAYKNGDSQIPREWSRISKAKQAAASAAEQEEQEAVIEKLGDTGRMMLLNIPYEATVDSVQQLCAAFGKVVEVKAPLSHKGLFYVTYAFPPSAIQAYSELNNSIFMGRKIRCLPSDECRDFEPIAKVCSARNTKSATKKMLLERKARSATNAETWNLLYVSASVATEVMAEQLGLQITDIASPGDAKESVAARVAIAESFVISQTKEWLATLGVPESIFECSGTTLLGAKLQAASESAGYSKTTFFVKHLGPWVGDGSELRKLLERHGRVRYFSLAPTRTIAIVAYGSASHAAATLSELSLYSFKSKPLYFEYAPALVDEALVSSGLMTDRPRANDLVDVALQPNAEQQQKSSTIYITNLSFDTSEEKLQEIFGRYAGFRRVSLVKTRKRLRDMATGTFSESMQSLGHGFVIFDTSEHAAVAMKDQLELVLDGHAVRMDWSKAADASSQPASTKEAATGIALKSRKIVVKNLDFMTSTKDVRDLFQAFGAVSSCRLPKRNDGRIRGFAFIEFASLADAQSAVKSLSDVRLLGRRLIIEPAEADASTAEASAAEAGSAGAAEAA